MGSSLPPKPISPVWHPFTQAAIQPQAIPVSRAEGVWLECPDGSRIIDAISSWWVITHGHGRPEIIAAINAQAQKLDQVIFAGFTHEPAEGLAASLIEIMPDELTRVFFSDSGSTSVEVALKMALGYWHNIGEPRQRVIALENAYHGDTVGTMSAGARGVFNQAYEPLLYDVVHLPFPRAGAQQKTLDALETELKTGQAAALIVEPLILGAGGMLIYDAATLSEMKRLCATYGTLFIADEVMTAWGRTGTLLACEQADIIPDILCLAKGLTGGALPLAATMASEKIYDAHFSTDRTKTFFHSSSFTANPIACAAARANVAIWQSEPVIERISAVGKMQQRALSRLEDKSGVTNVRRLGTIAALDISVTDQGYLSNIGPKLYDCFLSQNVLLRPLGNTVYVMPPYCITQNEIERIYDAIIEAVETL